MVYTTTARLQTVSATAGMSLATSRDRAAPAVGRVARRADEQSIAEVPRGRSSLPRANTGLGTRYTSARGKEWIFSNEHVGDGGGDPRDAYENRDRWRARCHAGRRGSARAPQ